MKITYLKSIWNLPGANELTYPNATISAHGISRKPHNSVHTRKIITPSHKWIQLYTHFIDTDDINWLTDGYLKKNLDRLYLIEI